jgi:hypothetical protein
MMNNLLKKLGYKTDSSKWDILEIMTDLTIFAIIGMILYTAIFIK